MSNLKLGSVVGVVAIICVLAGLVVGVSFAPATSNVGGLVHNIQEAFTEGATFGSTGQLTISNTGAISNSAAITATGGITIGSGTAIDLVKCATATWNPGSVGTSTLIAAATSTDIALSGAVMGDTCIASLSSATTSAAWVTCDVTGTATTTVKLVNISSSAVDYATGTARACIVSN